MGIVVRSVVVPCKHSMLIVARNEKFTADFSIMLFLVNKADKELVVEKLAKFLFSGPRICKLQD